MSLITAYAHKCDLCEKREDHSNVTLPKGWTVAEFNKKRFDLCAECTEKIEAFLFPKRVAVPE
jgi:hypothetical protein